MKNKILIGTVLGSAFILSIGNVFGAPNLNISNEFQNEKTNALAARSQDMVTLEGSVSGKVSVDIVQNYVSDLNKNGVSITQQGEVIKKIVGNVTKEDRKLSEGEKKLKEDLLSDNTSSDAGKFLKQFCDVSGGTVKVLEGSKLEQTIKDSEYYKANEQSKAKEFAEKYGLNYEISSEMIVGLVKDGGLDLCVKAFVETLLEDEGRKEIIRKEEASTKDGVTAKKKVDLSRDESKKKLTELMKDKEKLNKKIEDSKKSTYRDLFDAIFDETYLNELRSALLGDDNCCVVVGSIKATIATDTLKSDNKYRDAILGVLDIADFKSVYASGEDGKDYSLNEDVFVAKNWESIFAALTGSEVIASTGIKIEYTDKSTSEDEKAKLVGGKVTEQLNNKKKSFLDSLINKNKGLFTENSNVKKVDLELEDVTSLYSNNTELHTMLEGYFTEDNCGGVSNPNLSTEGNNKVDLKTVLAEITAKEFGDALSKALEAEKIEYKYDKTKGEDVKKEAQKEAIKGYLAAVDNAKKVVANLDVKYFDVTVEVKKYSQDDVGFDAAFVTDNKILDFVKLEYGNVKDSTEKKTYSVIKSKKLDDSADETPIKALFDSLKTMDGMKNLKFTYKGGAGDDVKNAAKAKAFKNAFKKLNLKENSIDLGDLATYNTVFEVEKTDKKIKVSDIKKDDVILSDIIDGVSTVVKNGTSFKGNDGKYYKVKDGDVKPNEDKVFTVLSNVLLDDIVYSYNKDENEKKALTDELVKQANAKATEIAKKYIEAGNIDWFDETTDTPTSNSKLFKNLLNTDIDSKSADIVQALKGKFSSNEYDLNGEKYTFKKEVSSIDDTHLLSALKVLDTEKIDYKGSDVASGVVEYIKTTISEENLKKVAESLLNSGGDYFAKVPAAASEIDFSKLNDKEVNDLVNKFTNVNCFAGESKYKILKEDSTGWADVDWNATFPDNKITATFTPALIMEYCADKGKDGGGTILKNVNIATATEGELKTAIETQVLNSDGNKEKVATWLSTKSKKGTDAKYLMPAGAVLTNSVIFKKNYASWRNYKVQKYIGALSDDSIFDVTKLNNLFDEKRTDEGSLYYTFKDVKCDDNVKILLNGLDYYLDIWGVVNDAGGATSEALEDGVLNKQTTIVEMLEGFVNGGAYIPESGRSWNTRFGCGDKKKDPIYGFVEMLNDDWRPTGNDVDINGTKYDFSTSSTGGSKVDPATKISALELTNSDQLKALTEQLDGAYFTKQSDAGKQIKLAGLMDGSNSHHLTFETSIDWSATDGVKELIANALKEDKTTKDLTVDALNETQKGAVENAILTYINTKANWGTEVKTSVKVGSFLAINNSYTKWSNVELDDTCDAVVYNLQEDWAVKSANDNLFNGRDCLKVNGKAGSDKGQDYFDVLVDTAKKTAPGTPVNLGMFTADAMKADTINIAFDNGATATDTINWEDYKDIAAAKKWAKKDNLKKIMEAKALKVNGKSLDNIFSEYVTAMEGALTPPAKLTMNYFEEPEVIKWNEFEVDETAAKTASTAVATGGTAITPDSNCAAHKIHLEKNIKTILNGGTYEAATVYTGSVDAQATAIATAIWRDITYNKDLYNFSVAQLVALDTGGTYFKAKGSSINYGDKTISDINSLKDSGEKAAALQKLESVLDSTIISASVGGINNNDLRKNDRLVWFKDAIVDSSAIQDKVYLKHIAAQAVLADTTTFGAIKVDNITIGNKANVVKAILEYIAKHYNSSDEFDTEKSGKKQLKDVLDLNLDAGATWSDGIAFDSNYCNVFKAQLVDHLVTIKDEVKTADTKKAVLMFNDSIYKFTSGATDKASAAELLDAIAASTTDTLSLNDFKESNLRNNTKVYKIDENKLSSKDGINWDATNAIMNEYLEGLQKSKNILESLGLEYADSTKSIKDFFNAGRSVALWTLKDGNGLKDYILKSLETDASTCKIKSSAKNTIKPGDVANVKVWLAEFEKDYTNANITSFNADAAFADYLIEAANDTDAMNAVIDKLVKSSDNITKAENDLWGSAETFRNTFKDNTKVIKATGTITSGKDYTIDLGINAIFELVNGGASGDNITKFANGLLPASGSYDFKAKGLQLKLALGITSATDIVDTMKNLSAFKYTFGTTNLDELKNLFDADPSNLDSSVKNLAKYDTECEILVFDEAGVGSDGRSYTPECDAYPAYTGYLTKFVEALVASKGMKLKSKDLASIKGVAKLFNDGLDFSNAVGVKFSDLEALKSTTLPDTVTIANIEKYLEVKGTANWDENSLIQIVQVAEALKDLNEDDIIKQIASVGYCITNKSSKKYTILGDLYYDATGSASIDKNSKVSVVKDSMLGKMAIKIITDRRVASSTTTFDIKSIVVNSITDKVCQAAGMSGMDTFKYNFSDKDALTAGAAQEASRYNFDAQVEIEYERLKPLCGSTIKGVAVVDADWSAVSSKLDTIKDKVYGYIDVDGTLKGKNDQILLSDLKGGTDDAGINDSSKNLLFKAMKEAGVFN